MKIRYQSLRGAEITPYLPEIAQLRIVVFAEYPYCYAGDAAYEARYLQRYVACADSFCILAWHENQLIGASTAMPLSADSPEFQQPFLKNKNFNINQIFYFGESVVLHEYRGFGIGARFFDARENAACSTPNITQTAFCAVQRTPDDPRRPADYRSPEALWNRRCYTPRPDLTAEYSWQEIGDSAETAHLMQFWVRDL